MSTTVAAQRSVERGDEVKEGAVVAQLDTSSAALALKQAQVDVLTQKTQDSISQTERARYEQLIATGAISPAEYDNVTAKCKTAPLIRQNAEARQNIAAKSVADGTIRHRRSDPVAPPDAPRGPRLPQPGRQRERVVCR